MKKEEYIKIAKNKFKGKALKLVLNQIELFYNKEDVIKTKYNKGDFVYLKKGTFLHGLGLSRDAFDLIVDNGFIAKDFTVETHNKIFNSIGMWNIQKDIYLSDYIKFYSGATFKYFKINKDKKEEKYIVAPFNEVESTSIKINNMEDVWMWTSEQTKEVRFMPSLASDKVQIGFILNMESEYAKKLAYADFYNKEMDKNVLKYFCVKPFLKYFLMHPLNPSTTDRESSIFFGLPSSLIEGVLVGRIYENNKEKLDYIKSKLPDCYICNLDGKVIVSNKE